MVIKGLFLFFYGAGSEPLADILGDMFLWDIGLGLFTCQDSQDSVCAVSAVAFGMGEGACDHIAAISICIGEDALQVISGCCAALFFEALIIGGCGFPQSQEGLFQELALSGDFFVDLLMLGQDLSSVLSVEIGVLAIEGLIDPDFEVGGVQPDPGMLSDKVGVCAVAVGIDGHTEIGVDETIHFLIHGF